MIEKQGNSYAVIHKKSVEKTEKEIRKEKEIALKEKLRMASYCPKISGQSWSHVGRDK